MAEATRARWWRFRRPFRHEAGVAELAVLVHRLAVLLAAGVAPATAWRHLGPAVGAAEVAEAAIRAGPAAIPDAIAAVLPGDSRGRKNPGPALGAWSGLATTWSVAVTAGAPLAPTLRAYAALLRGYAEAERAARTALAGPRATSRLVLVLPVVAVAFGALLGQDTLGVLLGTPLGWGCLAVGGSLMLGGRAWSRRLLRGAAADPALPGLSAELTAVALSAGVSVPRARELVVAAIARYGVSADPEAAEATLRLAMATGAPAAELLRAEAEEARRAAVGDAAERAERLSVTLMLPLGVCVLPAFVAVGVVPMMAAIIATVMVPL
jgi:tight adherence protein B